MEKNTLPNATAVLVLGILSILTCWCYGVVGLILGIIAMVLAAKDRKLYNENPELYSNYSNLNVGRILAIIGISLSALYLIVTIVIVAAVGMDGLEDFQNNLRLKMEQNESDY